MSTKFVTVYKIHQAVKERLDRAAEDCMRCPNRMKDADARSSVEEYVTRTEVGKILYAIRIADIGFELTPDDTLFKWSDDLYVDFRDDLIDMMSISDYSVDKVDEIVVTSTDSLYVSDAHLETVSEHSSEYDEYQSLSDEYHHHDEYTNVLDLSMFHSSLNPTPYLSDSGISDVETIMDWVGETDTNINEITSTNIQNK